MGQTQSKIKIKKKKKKKWLIIKEFWFSLSFFFALFFPLPNANISFELFLIIPHVDFMYL